MADMQDLIDDDQEEQKKGDQFSVLDENQVVVNEKIKRCENFKDGNDVFQPTMSYKENSPKEELVLEHVIDFKKQFMYHMQQEDQRDLFLYPNNECGVYKFICTTIRPTKLGFMELYEFDVCAKHISQYIQYEQLEIPNEFPKIIPSPTNVARWQKGDCFDMSILLTSLLIGVGYDAYCVYGKAPREITTKNESLLECLYKNKGRLEEDDKNKKIIDKVKNDFTINRKQKVYSKYDRKVEEQKIQEEAERKRKAETIDDDQPDELPDDIYAGKRIHCWVLLKSGKRNVEQNVFIEPSTGRLYYPNGVDCPYECVDAIFNNHNFWINMHPDLPVKEINFEEIDTSDLNWEYVMLDTLQFQSSPLGDDDAEEAIGVKKDQDQADLEDIAQQLDMPPSWPPKIFIDKEQFLRGTPLGEDTVYFNKVKVDNYCPYEQSDGLVQKITIYQDYKKLKLQEVRYFYQHRSDKLSIRRKFPFEFKTVEDYEKTKYEDKHTQQWKRVTEYDRHLRIIDYYHNRNHDGLVKRIEEIGQKTCEYYEGRDDKIIYRSTRFSIVKENYNQSAKDYLFPDNHVGQVKCEKMTLKYERNPYLPANQQIAKMVSNSQDVKVYYHLEHDEIAPLVKNFERNKMLGISKQNDAQSGEKNYNEQVSQQETQKMHNLEKECYQGIKAQETKAKDDYSQMKENGVYLEETLDKKVRDKFKKSQKKAEEEVSKESQEQDYLYPYLVSLKYPLDGKELSYDDAINVKNEVMSKLKERLLSRAEIIQKRLEEERQNQLKIENQMTKKQEVDKNNDEKMQNVTFKIQILESRALRFETTAIAKYEEMDRRLNEDPRLAKMHNKNL